LGELTTLFEIFSRMGITISYCFDA